MTDESRDCAQLGHVWLEADNKVFVRHRGREKGPISVHCMYCDRTGEMEAHGAFTKGGPGDTKPNPIPPNLKQVVEHTVENTGKTGPVPKVE